MECVPYGKVGGMADVVGALPGALEPVGIDARTVVPYYPRIYKGKIGEELAAFDVYVGDVAHPVRLLDAPPFGILIDQPAAFDRAGIYNEPNRGEGFGDNLFRCLVLQQAVRTALARGDIEADIVHCHDNHTGLLPVYLKDDGGPPSVFTVHNLAYQGLYGGDDFWLTGLHTDRFFGHSGFEFYGDLSLMKAGLLHADRVTTVSPSYAKEILDPRRGHSLDGVLRLIGDRLVGILNGIDTGIWDPATDELLPARYTPARPGGKKKCKAALRERAGLEVDDKAPLIGMVSRVTHQKGLDLVGACLPGTVRAGAQLVLLGSGDPAILDLFRGAQGRWPGRVALLEGYDEELAHLVYAGSDIFCIPSRFEPCGLSQMYAMRYGSVPVATRMGGLIDTVAPFDRERTDGTGVLADWATSDSFFGALEYALELYTKPQLFRKMRRNGMERDFSWKASAERYADLYRELL